MSPAGSQVRPTFWPSSKTSTVPEQRRYVCDNTCGSGDICTRSLLENDMPPLLAICRAHRSGKPKRLGETQWHPEKEGKGKKRRKKKGKPPKNQVDGIIALNQWLLQPTPLGSSHPPSSARNYQLQLDAANPMIHGPNRMRPEARWLQKYIRVCQLS
ncbi:uncharacterized protein LY79DRAFT_143538 [Colletotrichum navitas]|uniref:Uncharacterized protein n=1 Tax=Colletotrichum navitas TaxID=681940 RepID=A0AAD8QBA7_9PEZI|nr:uncharacterized protein LY79DRAFT_143538 [Colletotrichum navitas]KAK1599528.1 hypothetical protein LY79DRAFT_143538 [Colletotrichum navitas]